LAFEVALLCEQRGVHLTFSYYEPVIRFLPPLVISRAEIDEAIGVLDEVLAIVAARRQDLQELLPKNPRSGPFVSRMMGARISPVQIARKMWRTSPQQWLEKLRALGS
jgi:hypothetical protein